MVNTEKLIREVYVRRKIWDQKSSPYQDRGAVFRGWIEIAAACNTTPSLARSKWRNLRDYFCAEYKRQSRAETEAQDEGRSPPPAPMWTWYKDLMFLKDQVDIVNPVRYTPGLLWSRDPGLIEGEYDAEREANRERVLQTLERRLQDLAADISKDEPPMDMVGPQNTCNKRPAPEKNTAKKQRIERPVFARIIDYEQEQPPANNRNEVERMDDDSYHFLMSLYNPLNGLPKEREMYIRYKIQELIYNELYIMDRT